MKPRQIVIFTISVVLSVLFFTEFDLSFSPGLDNSYIYAYNYFFEYMPDMFSKLVFPFGPLSVLRNPFSIGNNFYYAVLFRFFTLFVFSYLALTLSNENSGKEKTMPSAAFIIICLLFFKYDYFITINVVLGLAAYYLYKSRRGLLMAVIFLLTGILTRSFTSLICLSVLPGYIVFVYFSDSAKKRFYWEPLLYLLVLAILLSVLIFHSSYGVFLHVYQTLRLSLGYSSALALLYDNSYSVLLSLTAFYLLFGYYLRKQQLPFFVYVVSFPAFVLSFKYAFSRQDIMHYSYLGYFVVIFGFTLISFQKKHQLYSSLVVIALVGLLQLNISDTTTESFLKPNFSGIVHFHKNVLTHNSTFEKVDSINKLLLQGAKLDTTILLKTGTKTIDFYPWEFSYVAANKLNWRPRTTLQSGINSEYTDRLSAAVFANEEKPEMLLWHFMSDKYGSTTQTVDNKYFLNDDPNTVYSIFSNYDTDTTTPGYMLLRTSGKQQLERREEIVITGIKPNEWIPVPNKEKTITRLKLTIKLPFAERLKNLLIPADVYYIEYLLADGRMYKYRFAPGTAVSGLWASPYVASVGRFGTMDFTKTKAVRISSERNTIENCTLSGSWEHIGIADEDNRFFAAYIQQGKGLVTYENSFENNGHVPFSGTSDSLYKTGVKEGTGRVFALHKQQYSPTFSSPLSTFKTDSLTTQLSVAASAKLCRKNNESVFLVISVDAAGKNYMWEAVNGVTLDKDWDYLNIKRYLSAALPSDATVSVYVWNNGNEMVYVDDLKIGIKPQR